MYTHNCIFWRVFKRQFEIFLVVSASPLPIGRKRTTRPGSYKEARLRTLIYYKYRNRSTLVLHHIANVHGSCFIWWIKKCKIRLSPDPSVRTTVRRITPLPLTHCGYRFSAFWLRSSVVSVLISLISDTSPTRGPYIKLIFGTGRWNRGLLRPLHASTWYCSISRNGAPPSAC